MGINLNKSSHILFFVCILPIMSIVLAYLTSALLTNVIPNWIVFLIDTAGPLGYYSWLYRMFDKYLWRFVPFWLHIIDAPNLEGRWEGQLYSSFNGKRQPYKCAVEIIQTFSDIKIFCYFSQSWSRSIVANFYDEPDARKALHYEYYNEPNEGAKKGMNAHYGASRHYLEGNTMKCFYYNEPEHDRGKHGNFTVTFKQKGLLKKI